MMYPSQAPTGPPEASADPDPMNRPARDVRQSSKSLPGVLTSSNSTTKGNHGHVPLFECTVHTTLLVVSCKVSNSYFTPLPMLEQLTMAVHKDSAVGDTSAIRS